jgi:hypothetical protein
MRNSFVSNSSSTSFLCKLELEVDDVIEYLKKLLDIHNDFHGVDLSLSNILDIWGQYDGIRIMPEYENSIPTFMKSFIMAELNGEEVIEED